MHVHVLKLLASLPHGKGHVMFFHLIIRHTLGVLGLALLIMMTGSCVTDRCGRGVQAVSPVKELGHDGEEPGPRRLESGQLANQPARSAEIEHGEITGVNIEQLFAMIHASRVLCIDCRPPIFYHMGHIDGAMNLPLKRYDKVIESCKGSIEQALADNKVVVLYCQNVKCPDAYNLAKKLARLGYSISVYKGGWKEWTQSGL